MSSEPKNSNRERLLALIACLLITFCMGTVHAFSTLIQNIEIQTGVGRMASSLVYSIALVNVTLAVFFGHILYRKLSPNLLILLIMILPIIGLFFSSSQSWLGWIVGYGFLFGLSSGLGYGLSLFIVSSITERDKLGYALGLVTASYAFGAVAFSMLYPFLFRYFGFISGYIIGLVSLSSIVMIGLACYKFSNVRIKKELHADVPIQSRNSKIIPLWLGYFLGVFAGGFIFVLSYAFFPVFKGTYPPMIGASAGVMSVFIFICTYTPEQEIRVLFFNVKLKYIGIVFFFFDVIQIPYGNAGGHLAHIGGALLGFSYARQLVNGRDIGSGFEQVWQYLFIKKQLKTVYKSPNKERFNKANKNGDNSQIKIDAILDKISKSGYDSLSKEEKDYLFEAGKK